MADAVIEKQLVITVDNHVGALADVCRAVALSGINLVATCAHVVDNKGIMFFVTDNNEKARKVLKEKKFDVREEEVVLLSLTNKPGALQIIAEKIAQAGIDLMLVYGSVEKDGKASTIVVVSNNNKAVLAAIKK